MLQSDPGFTLVEVLVALAITAIVGITIMGSISGMASRISSYRDDTQLHLLTKALAHDIALRGIPKTPMGSFDTHPDYKWTIEVFPLQETLGLSLDHPIQEIVLTVTAPNQRTFSSRMLYRS